MTDDKNYKVMYRDAVQFIRKSPDGSTVDIPNDSSEVLPVAKDAAVADGMILFRLHMLEDGIDALEHDVMNGKLDEDKGGYKGIINHIRSVLEKMTNHTGHDLSALEEVINNHPENTEENWSAYPYAKMRFVSEKIATFERALEVDGPDAKIEDEIRRLKEEGFSDE